MEFGLRAFSRGKHQEFVEGMAWEKGRGGQWKVWSRDPVQPLLDGEERHLRWAEMLSSARVEHQDGLAGEGESGAKRAADRKGCSYEFWGFLLTDKPKGCLMAQDDLPSAKSCPSRRRQPTTATIQSKWPESAFQVSTWGMNSKLIVLWLSSSRSHNSREGRGVLCELVCVNCVSCLSRHPSVTFWTLGGREGGLPCLQAVSQTGSF